MKAFLLAAGHGIRLRPYTDRIPKCLLPVRGVPMLGIWLALCRKHGVSDVLVNTHAHAPAVTDFMNKWRNGLHVFVAEEHELYGSAGTLRANREWVRGEKCFWVFYADVLTNVNLEAIHSFHEDGTAATIGVYSVPDPARCGIVEVDPDGTVRSFVEKPPTPESNLAFAGILLGTPELLDAIPDKPECDIAFDVLPRLAGRMRAYQIPEFVLDIGTPENYQLAQQSWPGTVDTSQEQHAL